MILLDKLQVMESAAANELWWRVLINCIATFLVTPPRERSSKPSGLRKTNVGYESMRKWEADLIRFLDTSHPGIGKDILEKGRITEENEKTLREALETFKSTWQA